MSCAVQCYALTPAAYYLFYLQQGLMPSASQLERMLSSTPTFFNWKAERTDGESLSRVTIIEPEDIGGLWAWREKAAEFSVVANRVHLEGERVASMEDITYVAVKNTAHPFRESLLSPEYFIVLFQHFTQEEYVFNRSILRSFAVELARWRDFCPEHQEYLRQMQDMLPYFKVIHGEQSTSEGLH